MRPKPPCKDCTDRREGCHGVCLYYKAYRARMDADSTAKLRRPPWTLVLAYWLLVTVYWIARAIGGLQ